jgi:predicted RecA/RadA family phage recombinase
MPEATFVQTGDLIDYTPSSDVAAGQVVVQSDLVGVANKAITANTLGALAVSGVFDFAKATGAGTAISAGALVYWDDTSNVATTTSTGNKLIGKAIKAATTSDSTVRVRLSQ